jgi:two-component sensor histidine kinase/PAS domain-containing protein
MALAVLLRAALDPLVPALPPFITLYPAVALAGLLCGPLSAALATAFGMVAADFLWLAPRYTLNLNNATGTVSMALFALACSIILWAVFIVRTQLTAATAAQHALDLSLRAGGIGTWEIDLRTRRIKASNTAYALHGLPESKTETLPDDWLVGINPDDTDAARTALQAAVTEGALATYSYRVTGAADEVKWISARGRVVADGNRKRLLCALVDMTAQIRMQDELQRERERLRLALEAGSLAVWEYDPATGEAVIDAQYASTMGFGRDVNSLTRAQIGERIHPEDRHRVAAEHEAAVAGGSDYHIEYRLITMSGDVRWVVSQGRVIAGELAPQSGRIVGIIQDVTGVKRREIELQELAAAREWLIREADHRIKNSLQMVIALLTLQLRGITDPDAADALRGAITRVGAIAASHLALQSSADLQQVDLAVILREVCGHFAQLQPAISIRCRATGPLMLDADRAIPLGLVVSEVLTNALRHGFRGRASGAVTVDASTEAGALIVSIGDDGIGMSPQSGTTGLGSKIIRSLTAQLAASLHVESGAAGTTVTIRLALMPEEPVRLVAS